jgi:hypothetical protein
MLEMNRKGAADWMAKEPAAAAAAAGESESETVECGVVGAAVGLGLKWQNPKKPKCLLEKVHIIF